MGEVIMSAVIFAIALAVLAITLLWAELRPRRAEQTYNALEGARKVVASGFLIIFALTALQSGRWYLIVAALLGIFAAALYIAVEKPHRNATRRVS